MKRFMPLWFADIISTEEKLRSLAEKGYHLNSFSPLSGMFIFEEGEQKAKRYRICKFSKGSSTVPKGLIRNGWEEVCKGKVFYTVLHSDPNVESVPSYDSWKTANRFVIILVLMIMCYVIGFFLGFGAAVIEKGTYEELTAPGSIIHICILIVSAMIMAISIKANRKLSKTNTDLNLAGSVIATIPKENFIYTPEEEKAMLKARTMMKKTILGWFYAPDKAEEYVENMARQGWKFYRFDKMGLTFFFIKCEPCLLKFVVDYQQEATDGYFASAKDDGWKLEFTSAVRSMSYTIWSQEYDEEENAPMFYSDDESNYRRAKRSFLTIALPMLISAVLFTLFIVSISADLFDGFMFTALGIIILYIILISEFLFFGIKSLGYFIRMRKKLNK